MFMFRKKSFYLGIVLSLLFSFTSISFGAPPASPYNAGETLDPSCAPGDVNCTVVAPQAHHAYLDDLSGIVGAAGDLFYFDGSDWVSLAMGGVGQVLSANAGGMPVWGDMTSFWTKSGTNLSPSTAGDDILLNSGENLTISDMNQGSVLFSGTSGLVSQDNSNLFWNDVDNRLGIRNSDPNEALTVNGNILGQQIDAPVRVGNSGIAYKDPVDMDIQGQYAYVIDNTLPAFYGFDISDSTNPISLFELSHPSFAKLRGIAIRGAYVYIIDDSGLLFIFNISDPSKPEYVTIFDIGIKGIMDIYVQGKYAYVIANDSTGTPSFIILDITDPKDIVMVGQTTEHLKNPVAVFASGKYVYITDAAAILLIYNISNPLSIDYVSAVSSFDKGTDLYVSGDYVYALQSSQNMLFSINISDINSPQIVTPAFFHTHLDHPTSVYLSGHYLYVAGGDSFFAVDVYDVIDPANPVLINSFTSGSLKPAHKIVVNDRFAYVLEKNTGVNVFELNYAEFPVVESGSIGVNDLQVYDDALFDNDISVYGGVTVGRSLLAQDTVSAEKRISIASSADNYALRVGDPGDGTEAIANKWNTFSDSRYKTDVSPILNALDKVLNLNGVYYTWIRGVDTSTHVGFIAQDVNNVFPEVVSIDKDGYFSLDYSKFTPLLVEAIKELDDNKIENDSIDSGIGILKAGDTVLHIDFNHSFSTVPVVTASLDNFVNYKVVNVNVDGFDIVIEDIQSEDVNVNWIAVNN